MRPVLTSGHNWFKILGTFNLIASEKHWCCCHLVNWVVNRLCLWNSSSAYFSIWQVFGFGPVKTLSWDTFTHTIQLFYKHSYFCIIMSTWNTVILRRATDFCPCLPSIGISFNCWVGFWRLVTFTIWLKFYSVILSFNVIYL